MKLNKKQQFSLFLVAMSASSAASASTCTVGNYDPLDGSACVPASPGNFVPVAGASTQTPAPAGTFVPGSGATGPTAASAGHYVPNSGASAQTNADPGYYVPITSATVQTAASPGFFVPNAASSAQSPAGVGTFTSTSAATAAQQAARGFYVPVTGSSNELPAGGMAAPLVAASQTQTLFQTLSTDLLDDGGPKALKAAFAYQHNNVDQDGLTSKELHTNLEALAIEGDLYHQNDEKAGITLAVAHHNINGSRAEADNNGNSYQVGAFGVKGLFGGQAQTSIFYGQTSSDNKRSVTTTGVTNNNEVLTSDQNISWYGANGKFSYPIANRINASAQLGLTIYHADGFSETGTATSAGTPTASVTALSARGLTYASVPSVLSVGYDVVPKASGQYVAPVEIKAGMISDLSGKQHLRLSSLNATGYNFDLPVQQTSIVSGFAQLKFNAWNIGNDFRVSGTLGAETGSHITGYQAGIQLVKSW